MLVPCEQCDGEGMVCDMCFCPCSECGCSDMTTRLDVRCPECDGSGEMEDGNES